MTILIYYDYTNYINYLKIIKLISIYIVMTSEFGLIKEKDLLTFHTNNSFLAGHVSHSVSCVEHSTGALGHGPSVALGVAIGLCSKKYQNNPLSFCVLIELKHKSFCRP